MCTCVRMCVKINLGCPQLRKVAECVASASGQTVPYVLANQHEAFAAPGQQQRSGEVPIEEAADESENYEDWNLAQTAAWAKKQAACLHGVVVEQKLQGRHLERITVELLTQR